jgi:hypothetical protein
MLKYVLRKTDENKSTHDPCEPTHIDAIKFLCVVVLPPWNTREGL